MLTPHVQLTLADLDARIHELTTMRTNLATHFGAGGNPVIIKFGPTPPQLPDEPAAPSVVKRRGRPPGPKKMKRIQKLNQNPERPFGSLIKKSADKAPDVTTAALLIKIGAKLKVPFTAGDLVAKSGCDMKKAQNTLTRWKVKKWVESVSRGAYEHTKTFGQEKGDLVETAATVREEEPKALPPAPVNGKTAAAGSSYDLPEGSLERKVYHQAMKLPDPFTAAALGVALGFSADAAALTLAKLEKKAMVKNVGVEDGDVLYSIA